MTSFLEDRFADLRYAARMLRKNPAFTAVAVLSLGLGIGANTAIFTLVDAVLLKTLPVKDPHQLYVLARNPERPSYYWTYPDYAAARDYNTGFSGLIGYGGTGPFGFTTGATADAQTEVATGVQVSGNYFQVLGVEPALGRLLNEQDDAKPGAGPYVVLSHAFWTSRFAASPAVIGTTVRINGYPFEIVGVARREFTGIEIGVAPDFYVPMMMRTELTKNPNWNNRNNSWFTPVGRLKHGASIAQLETELYNIGLEQEKLDRRTALNQRFVNRAAKVKLMPGAQGYSRLRARLSRPLIVLMIVVGVVLLIACANVANLLLARAAARRREIAVRLAVGSTRARLVWQLLTESTLLGLIGGAAGLAFAYLGVQALLPFMPQSGFTAVDLDVTPDARLLGFTFALSVLTGTLFGLAPALQSTKPALVPALRQEAGSTGGHGGFLLRKGLVVVQVSLSLLLLIGAGLFVRTLGNLHALDAGFHKDHLLLITVEPVRVGYKGQRLRDFYERLRERTAALPGVRTAVLARITPLGGSRWNQDISIPGEVRKPGGWNIVDQNAVSPRFFETMGIPIVLGRDFRVEDGPAFSPTPPDIVRVGAPPPPELEAGTRVAIVNESMVKRFFPNQNPIGMRFSFGEKYQAERGFEIVGVVKDAHYFGLREKTEPMSYQPIWRPGPGGGTLVLRTSGDPERLIESVRREILALDSAVPLLNARTIRQQIDNNLVQEKIVATLSGFFGILALLLASVGLYGVMAHLVTRRTREIGLRMALGAERGGVLWLVLREALVLVILGTAIGVPAALGVTKFAESILYGIAPRDPLATAGATVLLLTVALVASYLPARRASRLDPNKALQYE